MGKKANRDRKNQNRAQREATEFQIDETPERDRSPLKARTEAQGHYMLAIESSQLVFGLGPAGTGKTWCAAALAAEALAEKRVKRVIVTRPVVEAGESLGYLPGTAEEKFDPYFRPVRDVFNRRLGGSHVDYLVRKKTIETMPLAYLRGVTFEDAFVLFDEAQNATKGQMKLFLTRIGDRCKIVVNGDIRQRDVAGAEGLEDAVHRLGKIKGVRICEFGQGDVVRSGLAAKIVAAYES
jgi:phosphate starvation-inducible PhoH-like protein